MVTWTAILGSSVVIGGSGYRAASVLGTRPSRYKRLCSGRGTSGDQPTLSRWSRIINSPVSCLSILWTGSWWQVRWIANFYSFSKFATLQHALVGVPCTFFSFRRDLWGAARSYHFSLHHGKLFDVHIFLLSIINAINFFKCHIHQIFMGSLKAIIQSLTFFLIASETACEKKWELRTSMPS